MILLDIPNTFDLLKWASDNFQWVVIGAGIIAVIIIVMTIIKLTKFTRNLVHNILHERLFFILLFIGLVLLAIVLNKYEII
jgi:DMSO/TMAO reductase YedYZ heme-binding membrane subunit